MRLYFASKLGYDISMNKKNTIYMARTSNVFARV